MWRLHQFPVRPGRTPPRSACDFLPRPQRSAAQRIAALSLLLFSPNYCKPLCLGWALGGWAALIRGTVSAGIYGAESSALQDCRLSIRAGKPLTCRPVLLCGCDRDYGLPSAQMRYTTSVRATKNDRKNVNSRHFPASQRKTRECEELYDVTLFCRSVFVARRWCRMR